MEAKIRKDVPLFKRILTHDKFGDNVEEIHFSNVVCFTGFAIGAAPPGSPSDVPLVNMFAHDLHTLSGSRYANVAYQCDFPSSGQRKYKVEPVFTKKLMVRGQYQTLPLTIMGWSLPAETEEKGSDELTEAASKQLAAVVTTHRATDTVPHSILPPTQPFTPPFLTLPPPSIQALQSLLPKWASVRHNEQAMRFQALNKSQLQAIVTVAESVCQAAARKSPVVRPEARSAAETAANPAADVKEEPEVDLVGNTTLAGGSDSMLLDLHERMDTLPAAEAASEAEHPIELISEADLGQCAAYMAAEWCAVLGGTYTSTAAGNFGLVGLAAAVVVASCPRHASHFIAAQGMSALASCVRVRSKSVVRFAVTAIELLTRTAGAYACEAALGWVDLPELSEEVILAAQAKAASLGPRMAQRGGQGGSSPGTLARDEAGTRSGRDQRTVRDHDGDTDMADPIDAADNQPDQAGSERHMRHSQDSRQQHKQGQDGDDNADEQPLVEYDDDQADPGADYDYRAANPEEDEYGGQDQAEQDPQYDDDNGGQQHRYTGAEDKDAYEDQQDQYDDDDDDVQQPQQSDARLGDENQKGKNDEGGGNVKDEWDIAESEANVDDEMMAETPEQLSDAQDVQQDKQAASPQQTAGSDAEKGSSGRQRRRENEEPASQQSIGKPDAVAGKADGDDASRDQQQGRSSDRHRRGEEGKESRRSRSDKEKRHRHSRERHRSRDRSRDRDADRERRHKERKSRSKRSRSREHDGDRSKRSRHGRSHHSKDRTTPEAAASRQHGGPDDRPSRANSPAGAPARGNAQEKKLFTIQKAKQFSGCYYQLVLKFQDVLPKQMVATGTALFARLRLYAAVAQATEAAEQLVKAHPGAASQLTWQSAQKNVHTLSTNLVALSEQLLKSDEPVSARQPAAVGQKQEGHLPALVNADPCTVASFESRQLLELLAAVLHVPSLHAAQLMATGALPPQYAAPQIESAFMSTLLTGCKALVAALLSTPSGLAYLVQQPEATQSFLTALQTRSVAGKQCALTLATTLDALTALQQVCQQEASPASASPLGSPAAKSSTQEVLQALCEQSVSPTGRKAVAVAISNVPGALHQLMGLLQVEVKKEDAKLAKPPTLTFDLTSMCAAQLLLEFMTDEQPCMLSRWALHAADLDRLAGAALASTGMARVRHTLQAVQARAQAALALADKGPTSLVQTLAGVLPPLASTDVKGVFVVEAEAAAQFMQDVAKSNKAEAGLQLLSAVLQQPNAGSDTLAATEANVLQVVERALHTATVLIKAAQADALWSLGCGDAIDDAKQAINRWQVFRLMLAACTATCILFAQLQQRNTILKSISLLDCLLGAHAAITTTSECLGAALGSTPGPETQQVLQARQALTGALKIWWDQSHSSAPDWHPALLPSIFLGAKAAAMNSNVDPNQAPRNLYSRICVISDLFPPEWPPVAQRKGVPHPPPTQMAYRAALARGLEPVKQGFRDMVNLAVASDSRMFRGALVRLAARAAGLGGGMGMLLAEPITKALAEVVTSSATFGEVRRVLEIIVPLAYRPSIKAAFLDLKLADSLRGLMERVVPILGQYPDAGSLCTMVLEAVLVLLDPEICLNPMAQAKQRVADETPSPAEGGNIAAVILASLSRLGSNAHVAKRILKEMSTHTHGRVMLRLGAAKWQSNMTGSEVTTAVVSKASLQWAASRLWAAAEAAGTDMKLRNTNQEVAQTLETVATLKEDITEGDLTLPSGPAPNRFAAAVGASVEAASAADIAKAAETSDFAAQGNAVAQLFDPASHTFWRNVRERAVAPVAAFGRAPVKWQVWQPNTVPAITSWMQRPLTSAKRSHQERLGVAQGGSGLPSPSQKLKTEAGASASAASSAGRAGIGPMPGDDLPPVIAPPGRSRAQQLRGRSSGNSSRPASLHVDDFEKAAGMAPSPAVPIVSKPSGLALPPPIATAPARSGSITLRDSGTPRSTSLTTRTSAGAATSALAPPQTPAAAVISTSLSPPPAPQIPAPLAPPPNPQPALTTLTSVKAEPMPAAVSAALPAASYAAVKAEPLQVPVRLPSMAEAAAAAAAAEVLRKASPGLSGVSPKAPFDSSPAAVNDAASVDLLAPLQAYSSLSAATAALAAAAVEAPMASQAAIPGVKSPLTVPEAPIAAVTAPSSTALPAQLDTVSSRSSGDFATPSVTAALSPATSPQTAVASAGPDVPSATPPDATSVSLPATLPMSAAPLPPAAAPANLLLQPTVQTAPMQAEASMATPSVPAQAAAAVMQQPPPLSAASRQDAPSAASVPAGTAAVQAPGQPLTAPSISPSTTLVSQTSSGSWAGAAPAAGLSHRDPRRAATAAAPAARPSSAGSRLPAAASTAPAAAAAPAAVPSVRAAPTAAASSVPAASAAAAAVGAGVRDPRQGAAGPAAAAIRQGSATASAARQAPGNAPAAAIGAGRGRTQPKATLSSAQQAQTAALLQALTKGGEELQRFLAAHPEMRAAMPVLLDSLRQMQ